MNEQFVSSEIAEKLKKLNFDEACLGWYEYDEDGEFLTLLSGVRGNKKYRHINGYFGVHICDLVKTKTLAPLWQQVQKWLREVHNIHIVISVDFYKDGVNYLWQVFKYAPEHKYCSIGTACYGDNGEYPTYEIALEAAIIKGLELIK